MKTSVGYENHTDLVVVRRFEDVEPILDANKVLYNDDAHRTDGIKKGWHHAARIPPSVIEKWMTEGVNFFDPEHWPKIRAKLNDKEYLYLRTARGKI